MHSRMIAVVIGLCVIGFAGGAAAQTQINIATVTNPDFDFVALYDEPFWLAHHRDDPLYTQDSITEEDFSRIELLLLADGHCLTQQVMNVCGRAQQAESAIGNELRASSLETLLQLVAAG